MVQLLRDGEVYDTVTLSSDNNWRYTWPELSADHHWQVVEHRTPEDYTVLIEREGITFVMTNTHSRTSLIRRLRVIIHRRAITHRRKITRRRRNSFLTSLLHRADYFLR